MKQVIVHDYKELAYVIKAGKLPTEKKPVHKGRWSIYYGEMPVEHDMTYPTCVNKIKVYQRFGKIYPDRTKFKIKPYNHGNK